MIIEEEQKVEIVEDTNLQSKTQEEVENQDSEFKQVQEDSVVTKKTYAIPLGAFILIFLCIIIILFGLFTFFVNKNSSVISKGIYIDKIDVSNLTKPLKN